VVLSASAQALSQKKMPFVWHIREHPPKQLLKIRLNIIRGLMLKNIDNLIFLSKASQKAWLGCEGGQVIPNFVDFNKFDRLINRVKTDVPIMLYLGGLSKIKGVFPLIKALAILKKRLPRFYCLMPGSEYKPPHYWQLNLIRKLLPVFGFGTTGQRAIRLINKFNLQKNCIRLPFQQNIVRLIASCDVLVFPAIRPHFARPVIEASAMAKPVVASKFDILEELIQNGKTGLLVEPNNPNKLTEALYDILTNPQKAKQMGEAGYLYARQNFSVQNNIKKIIQIYDKIR